MTALAKIFFIAGTIPFITLGFMHWLYTFMDMSTPRKLAPRDDAVRLAMDATTLKLTARTTMWKAWMGFNHSHSLGAIVFGLVFLILALQDFTALSKNMPLMTIAVVVPLIYLWVGLRFWFRTPIIGISVSAVCMLLAAATLVL
jgi:fucose 4-O-acetylase-like acetyltransferase